MGGRKPWIKSRSRRTMKATNGVAETALQGMGKASWSDAHQQLMRAEAVTRIDPNSPEGQAIAAKYAQKGQQS